jgi:hypothetical protein
VGSTARMSDDLGRQTAAPDIPDGGGPSPEGPVHTEAHPLSDGVYRQKTVGDLFTNINLIVTMAYGRAGSILIQSLFDSHPKVLTLPHLGAMYSLIPASIHDLDRQLDWFINKFPTIFDTSRGGYFHDSNEFVAAKFGPDGDEDLRVSSTEFKKQLLDIVNEYSSIGSNGRLSRKEFFVLVHLAYGLCVRSFDVTEIRYIFYHTHTYVHNEWQNMLEDFPELYFIGMTRDPRQDWTSWKKIHALRMQRDISDVPPICLFLSEYYYSKSSYELSNLTERLQPDHIRIIDLETLHILNKRAMTLLCSWLNLGFNESLLQSTFNGRLWHGNAASGKRASSLNPNMTRDAWRNELPEHERQIICSSVPGSIKYLGYVDDIPATGAGTENLINDLKYGNDLLLFIHCTLYLSGNPVRRFRKSWQNNKVNKIRAILSFGAAFYRGARLFFELRGNGLDRKIAEIMVQQKQLLQKNPPPRLAC